MASKRTINTFQEGMLQDLDKLNQPNSAYRRSKNGKLIFNEDGTYSWENEKGMKTSITINPVATFVGGAEPLTPVGYVSGPNYFILFSYYQNGDSEIGIITLDAEGVGEYKALYNDNGDEEKFAFQHEIKAILLPETDKLIRIYWLDGVDADSQRPCCFTIEYDDALPKSDVNAYSAVTQSVHNARLQAEFKIGIIKFVQNITGGLTTGIYQYAYRLVTPDGYRTTFSPLTRSIHLTVDSVDNSNWHNYEMEGVGIDSGKGIQLEIKGIDTRYSAIEVAYVHAQSSENVTDAAVFTKTEITGSIMTINHTSNEKTSPIDPSVIGQRFANIEKAKTFNIKDNTMYIGNIFEGDLNISPEDIIGNIQCKPIYKYMRDDEDTPFFFEDRPLPSTETVNPNADADYKIPMTHGFVRESEVASVKLHDGTGGLEKYQIINDYVNYKGTQVDNLFKGYKRGETYRFGIVFYDKLGQPGFVYHLADVKFPELYENTVSASRVKEDGSVVTVNTLNPGKAYISNDFGNSNNKLADITDPQRFVFDGDEETNRYNHLRILGIRFDNIDISSIRDRINGYQIVRAELDETILYQGVVAPCVFETEDEDPAEVRVTALPTPQQIWRSYAKSTDPDEWSDNGSTALNDDDLREPRLGNDVANQISLRWQAALKPNGNAANTPNVNDNNEQFYHPMPYFAAVYFPELFFEVEDTIQGPGINPNDRIKVVGKYYGDVHPSGENNGIQDDNRCSQMYSLHFNFDEFSRTLAENKGIVDQHTVQKLYYTNLSDKFQEDWAIHLKVGEKTTPLRKQVFQSFYQTQNNALGEFNTTLYQEVRFGFKTSDNADLVPFWDGDKKYYGSNINRCIYYKTEAWGDDNKQFPTFKIFEAPTRDILQDRITSPQSYKADYNGFNIVNYVRENNSPYGGLTKSSIETTVFESTGHFQPVNNDDFEVPDIVTGIEIFGGDTYIHCIDFVRIMPNWSKWEKFPEDGTDSFDTVPYPMGQAIIVPLESKINMALRQRASEQNPSFANNGLRTQGAWEGREEWQNDVSYVEGIYYWDTENKLEEEWNYQDALSYTETIQFFASKPFQAILDNRFPVRWRYSGVKIYGQNVDTFRQYLVNDARDMDGRYGDIIASEYLFDQIYVLQEEGFSRLRAYDRALVQTENLGTLTTGVGDRLQGQDYISVRYGTQHQYSVANSGKALYWVDAKKRKYCRFAQNGVELLSDVRGMHQFFDKMLPYFDNLDRPIFGEGIISEVDYTHNTIYLSFTGAGKYDTGLKQPPAEFPVLRTEIPEDEYTTISFNENINAFESFHSYVPNMYVSHKGFLLSIDTRYEPAATRLERVVRRGTFYVHDRDDAPLGRGSFYLKKFDSELEVITNESMMYHKTFDNIRMNVNDEVATTFVSLEMNTENQTEVLDIQNDNRCVLKENIFRVPLRTVDQLGRMRGKHIKNKFVFDNTELVRFTSLETLYRMSNRL